MNLKEKTIEGLLTRAFQSQFFSKCCSKKDSVIPVSLRLESNAQLIFSSSKEKFTSKFVDLLKQVPNSEIYSQSQFPLLIVNIS